VIIDRKPTPGVLDQMLCAATGIVAVTGFAATAIVTRRAYPEPPHGFAVSPDVETLWNRYEQHVEGREPLAGMAYACFTFVTKVIAQSESDAAERLNISSNVLRRLSALSGGKGQRKYPSAGPYSPQEATWVEAAIRLLIRRVGEAACGEHPLQQITMADLPKL
jgi:hypothetical protein